MAAQDSKPSPERASKRDWRLSEAAFHSLLKWLDQGADSRGETYLEMRRRLTSYFDRKSCQSPDDLADDTLNRVARRLEEEGVIASTTPARYCYTVARFVFLERLQDRKRDPISLDNLSASDPGQASPSLQASESDREQAAEKRLGCLEQCLKMLPQNDRDLIFEYYQGDQRAKIDNRQRLAERFGLTANALSIRACRIRTKLESCVRHCMEEMKVSGPTGSK